MNARRRRISGIAVTAATALGLGTLSACSTDGAGAGNTDKFDVVASFYPMQYLAEQIGGDHVNVTTLTEPGQEPHDLELSARQTAGMGEADAALYLKSLQPAVDEAVAQSDAKTKIDAAALTTLEDARGRRARPRRARGTPRRSTPRRRRARPGPARLARPGEVRRDRQGRRRAPSRRPTRTTPTTTARTPRRWRRSCPTLNDGRYKDRLAKTARATSSSPTTPPSATSPSATGSPRRPSTASTRSASPAPRASRSCRRRSPRPTTSPPSSTRHWSPTRPRRRSPTTRA
ncbi:hypothetical protein STENM223S_07406 [Streptomyces tendae]